MAGVCEEKCMGHSPGEESPNIDEMPELWVVTAYEACGWKSVPELTKGIEGKIYFFSFLSFVSLLR